MNKIKEIINILRGKKPSFLYRTGWEIDGQMSNSPLLYVSSDSPTAIKKEDLRIEKKPIEVFEEIISEEPKIDLDCLDEKIKLVRQRKDIIEKMIKRNPDDEIEALGFLESRKKYLKTKELFKWGVATISGIEKLCKKYKLKVIDLNSTTGHKIIPMEGILEIEKFIKSYKNVRQDDPIIKLILEDSDNSQAKEKKRRADPILLASSPFGKWFYVLGAWDREVELIEELIYRK